MQYVALILASNEVFSPYYYWLLLNGQFISAHETEQKLWYGVVMKLWRCKRVSGKILKAYELIRQNMLIFGTNKSRVKWTPVDKNTISFLVACFRTNIQCIAVSQSKSKESTLVTYFLPGYSTWTLKCGALCYHLPLF